MYPIVLGLHNLNRWILLFAGVYAAVRFWRRWLQRESWTIGDATAARLFTTTLDIQFMLGLLMFLFFSPLTRQAFSDVGAAMRNAPVRYFFVEHQVMMLVAIAIAHIGSTRLKRATSDVAKFKTGALWFGVAVIALLLFIPWFRPLVPSF